MKKAAYQEYGSWSCFSVCLPTLFLFLLAPALSAAQITSFIGCDKAPGEVEDGPHREWAICKARLPIVDARGRGAAFGTKVAVSGSHQYVILKVHGNRPDILERAETVMRSFAAFGYPSVGLVLADGMEPTVMEVFSGGRPESYDVLRKVDADNGELLIREVVKEAYERDIGPRARSP